MARRQTGAKPLPEPMVTSFTDSYLRHSDEMSSPYNNMSRRIDCDTEHFYGHFYGKSSVLLGLVLWRSQKKSDISLTILWDDPPTAVIAPKSPVQYFFYRN